jgi:hypothetical protein
MCCFSRSVSSVSNTNIFARAANDGRQYLAYSLKYEAADELAMILPIPTPANAAEDGVRFIDLSGYPKFFDDLRLGFPEQKMSRQAFQPLVRLAPQPAPLKVYDVGSFEASFVPQQKDFGRLDERFRLPTNAWDKLPQYKDWGFAVFKLKAGAKDVHPMAFDFLRRAPRTLFFPTVHIHDGQVHGKAEFDHSLYCQTSLSLDRNWEDSFAPAQSFVKVDQSQGLVEATQPVRRRRIHGSHKNEDIVIK